MSYRITTDSTSDLPRSFLQERDIPCVGLAFQLDGQEYREDENLQLTMTEFYNALRGGKMSSTMQVNTFEFLSFVEPFLAACCISAFPAASAVPMLPSSLVRRS